jgi:group I intron endonuclease
MNPSSQDAFIYKIVNQVTGKFYIGSTVRDLSIRFWEHRKSLNQGKHHSVYLQRAWDKYGADNFEFIPVRTGSSDQIRVIEQILLDRFQPYDPVIGYNMNHKVDSRYGRKMSVESRRKMSFAKKGKPSPRKGMKATKETRLKLSLSHKGQVSWSKGKICPQLSGENNGHYGKHHSKEVKQKISQKLKGRRSGKNNSFYGKSHSKETKEKMSAIKKGKPWSPARREAQNRRNRDNGLSTIG